MTVTTSSIRTRTPSWLRRWAALPVGLGAVAALVTLNPAVVGLSESPLFLQAVALRGLTGLGFLSGGTAAAVGLLLPRLSRPWLRLTTAGVLLLVGAAQLGIQIARDGRSPVSGAEPSDLTVLSFNTLGGATDTEQVAELARREGAQVIALPETWPGFAGALADRLATENLSFQVFSDFGHHDNPTSLLIRSDLGLYRSIGTPDTGYGAVRAVPISGDGPVLVAVHTLAPPQWGSGYRAWADTVATAAGLCTEADNAVVAGDFNATTDHGPLRGLGHCRDAADAAGTMSGTWPAWLSGLLSAPIDHVLFAGTKWRALSTHTVRAGGSDHRALIARLVKIG